MDSDAEDNYEYSSEEEETKEREIKIVDYNFKDANTVEPNIKCRACGKKFLLDKRHTVIRCVNCGCRILYKLRTKNSIYYSTD
jgi:DNA-directed RNA polymerase subunit RPC12/RpoP